MSLLDPELPESFPDKLAFPINYVMGAIYMGLYLLGIPVFVYLRTKEPIRSRGWVIPVFQMTVVLVELAIRIPGFYRVTCSVDVLRQDLLIPLWLYPYFVRVFVLWYNFNFQNVLLLRQTTTTTSWKNRLVLWIQARPWITSVIWQLIFIALMGAFTTALILGLFFTGAAEVTESCGFQPAFVLNIVQGAVAVLFLAVSVFVLWNVNDAYLLKIEFIILFATGLPLFILWAVSTVAGWVGFANPGFWVNLVQIVFLLATIYLPIYGTFHFQKYLRKKMAKSQSWNHSEMNTVHVLEENIRFVLDNDVLLRHLEQFMVQTWTIENLLFLRKHAEFKAAPGDKKLQIAQQIQAEFVAEGGLCQLNLEMKDREDINEELQACEASDDLFARAEKHVWSLLRYSIFPLWQGSSSFKDALKILGVASLDELKREVPSKRLAENLDVEVQMETL